MSNIRQTKDRLLARLFTRYPALLKKWARNADIVTFDHVPWTPLKKDIRRCRVALITTGGVHTNDQKPFDMWDKDGDASFREIPAGIDASDLAITHNHYDHSDADKDINVVFPIEILRMLDDFSEIGAAAPRHFSFMGHIKRDRIDALTDGAAPYVAAALAADAVDLVVLTPA